MGVKGVLAVAAAVLAGAAAAPAHARELLTVDLPSKGNVDASQVKFNGADHPGVLRANVLLPEGYDPSKRYPVLYLLHGAGESHTSWVRKTKADEVTKDLQAIVVMPDAATGFYTNHFNGGKRGEPGWERYFLDEVIPAIEERFPIRPGRRWHAVAGFSMGGFGTAYLASQLPGYFGAAAPMSGFLAPRRPEMPLVFGIATGQDYERIYGPADGPYVEGHDPVALAPNLKHTRMFVITGDGVPNPAMGAPNMESLATDAVGELDLQWHSADFVVALRKAGATVTHTNLLGTHNHPYWNDHLRRFLAWDPFAPVQDRPPVRWMYKTIADRGRAWNLSYRFDGPPAAVATLHADAGRYAVTGGSGAVELCDADGRGTVAEVPFGLRALTRAVTVRPLDRRNGRLRVELRSTEAADVRLGGRVVRGKKATALREVRTSLEAGQRRVVSLALPRGARGVARLVARHGTCAGGRWSTARAMLRG